MYSFLKLWMPVISSGLGATIFGFIGAYVAVRGGNLATKADTNLLKQQLETNTRITETIQQEFSERDYLRRRELEFRERQLSEFYGPAYGYLKSQRIIYNLWIDGKMKEKNFVVKQFLASQDRLVRNLIVAKAHLIDSPEMPEAFINFITDTVIFDIYAAGSDDGAVPSELSSDPRVFYPKEFDEHIFITTERLKKRVQQLYDEFAISLT